MILDSPVHPLKEGDKVTLHCLRRKNAKSNLRATFYKDGQPLQTQSSETLTIANVSEKDEGSYACKDAEKRRSHGSWVSVRGRETQNYHVRKSGFWLN